MSFLRDYITYASENEAPPMFHVWGGYVALASAISRKVWFPFGTRAMYPNIYVLLVGDAGNGKSLAMYNCRKLMSKVTPGISTSGSLETPPGLWRAMAGDPKARPAIPGIGEKVMWPDGQMQLIHALTITANEFIDFISYDDKGWINALNNIFDEDVYVYRTKNSGTDNLIGPYICMYGGLTTDIAADMQKQKIISTGLARRTIFQFGQRRFADPHAILEQTPEQDAAFERCLTHLNRLRTVAGPFSWDEETKAWWTAWYAKNNLEIPKRQPQLRSWYSSKADQVLKLGMLSALSEGIDLKLEIPHLKTALEFLEVVERDLYRIFGGVGRNELASVASSMFDFISNLSEPMSKKQLRVRLFSLFDGKNAIKEFEDCLQYLIDERRVQTYNMTVAVGGSSFMDTVIATPEVLAAWAERNSVVVPPLPVDVIQRELEKAALPSTGPSPEPTPAPLVDLPVAPPIFVLPTIETEAVEPQKPKEM